MEKMKTTPPSRKALGFTLVELVIVIAVIAILAAVLIPTFITVIDSANNSADVQLAANLNTALRAEVQLNSNVAASAQNIRFKAKEFGYEANQLATKKSDNVIAYNKETKRFEVLNVNNIKADQLVPAYYAEEVIDNYIIVSTQGNDLAEALYRLSNLPSESAAASVANISAIQPTMAGGSEIMPIEATTSESISAYVQDALDDIDDPDIYGMVTQIVESTLYINADGDMYYISIESDRVSAEKIDQVTQYTATNKTFQLLENGERPRTRVVFNQEVEEFPVDKLAVTNSGLSVIVPNTVTLTGSVTNADGMPYFSGNVNSDIIPAERIETAAALKELTKSGNEEAIIFYGINQVYTSDFGGSFAQALSMAKKLHGLQDDFKTENGITNDFSTIRLVVNSNSTITENITIPDYVTVEIPFAIGNSVAKEIMTYDAGDMLGGKALGSAYPANDSDNLGKTGNNQLYYLCGEGPGGGYDQAIYSYISSLTDENILPDDWDDQALADTLAIFRASNNISTTKAPYSITVTLDAILNIEGKITVGAIIGYPDASGYQGHTSGAYGYIVNNGIINVEKGGVLDVYGFIDGNGKVNANNGSIVYQPFVVADYLDTVGVLWLFPFAGAGGQTPERGAEFNSPFMRYTVMNIKNTFTMAYGSALYGRANLITFSSFLYCRANAPLVTSENYILDTYDGTYKKLSELTSDGWSEKDGTYTKAVNAKTYTTTVTNGAFSLTEGSTIVGTYDGNRNVKITDTNSEQYERDEPANKASLAGDIGVTTITLNGKINTYGIQMDLLGGIDKTDPQMGQLIKQILSPVPVNTAWCVLPLPYNLNFVVNGDLTIGNGNKYAVMPGSEIIVKESGKITIEENSALYVVDGYDSSEFFTTIDNILTRYTTDIEGDTKGNIFDLGQVFLPISLARKYYPSAQLLKSNGFDDYGKLSLEGSITVNAGGDLGGTITSSTTDAKIILMENAGVGRVLNLGGPYYNANMFMNNSDFYTNLNLGAYFLTTVSVPCYLQVFDAEGKNLITEDYYTENTKTSSNLVGNTLNIGKDSSSDIFKLEKTSSNACKYSYNYRTVKQALTLVMGATKTPVSVNSIKIANVVYEDYKVTESNYTLTVKDRDLEVNATYNGGWTIAA